MSLWTEIRNVFGIAEADASQLAGKVRAEVTTALASARATALAGVQHAAPEIRAAMDHALTAAEQAVEKVLAP